MIFPSDVLRWENLTRDEIARGGYPFPVELPLSVCLVESSGSVGEVNPNSGASGLMQIMPNTLKDYNKNNSPDIPLSHLRSSDHKYAPEQMGVGLWVMGRYLKQGYNWISETNPNPPLSDLIKVSDLMYVRGPAGVRSDFRDVTSRLFADLEERRPNYQPFAHPRKVWRWTAEENHAVWDMNAIDEWVTGQTDPPELPPPQIATQNGFIAALLVLAVASYYFSKKRD